MSAATYFVQACPICGRHLQVRLALLGKKVACQHCRGTFTAKDPSTAAGPYARLDESILRADRLLFRNRRPLDRHQ